MHKTNAFPKLIQDFEIINFLKYKSKTHKENKQIYLKTNLYSKERKFKDEIQLCMKYGNFHSYNSALFKDCK